MKRPKKDESWWWPLLNLKLMKKKKKFCDKCDNAGARTTVIVQQECAGGAEMRRIEQVYICKIMQECAEVQK